MAGLQDLIDRQDVEDVITWLFVGTDEKDWEQVRACFADEVLFDMGALTVAPAKRVRADEIIEAWRKGLEPMEAVHHQAGNFRVSLSGDEADARCYGIAYHYRPNVSGQNTRMYVGSYEFRLKRSMAGWLIDVFRFRMKFMEGNLELEKV